MPESNRLSDKKEEGNRTQAALSRCLASLRKEDKRGIERCMALRKCSLFF